MALAHYLAGSEAGKRDALAGLDWADNASYSVFYRDGYADAYLAN